MRIVYVINSGNFGGAEKHIKDLTKGMTERGQQVYVWCKPGPMAEKYTQAGAVVTQIAPKYDLDPSYIYKLWRFLRQEKIHVVHTHDLKCGVNAQIAAALAGTKVRVGHVHTPISDWQIAKLKKVLNIVMYGFVANFLIEREIALTHEGKNKKNSTGILSGKMVVIPNYAELPTDPSEERKNELINKWGFDNKFIIGNISRISEEKGQDILIKAFYSLSQEFDDLRLLLAGGGPLQKQCEELIEELKLSEKVVITGVFPDEDKATLYSALRVFVFPSRAEGFGYVPLEALSMQIPTVCSDLPVLKEVLGEHAVYFKANDPVDLANQLRPLIVDYQYAKKDMPDNTWIVQKYGFDKFIDSYLNLYSELL